MKRVLTFLALLLLPLSLMAMTPISDDNMSKVTGQAGVSIEVDMTLNMSFGQLGWADPDAGGGWIGLDNLQISTMHIWPRSDYTMEDGVGGTITPVVGDTSYDGGWADLKLLTIDVVTDTTDPFDVTLGYTTKVRIGIPTLSITMKEMTGNVVLGPRSNVETIGGRVNGSFNGTGIEVAGPTFDQMMGRFYVGGLNMALGGGTVDIYAHGRGSMDSAPGNGGPGVGGVGTMYGSGVTLTMTDLQISYLLIDKAAWGDLDGAFVSNGVNDSDPGLNHAGWVGLADLAIKNILINGSVLIDVASYTAGAETISAWNAWGEVIECWDEIYGVTGAAGQNGRTFVQIGFDNMVITMEKMGARAVLNMDAATTGITTPDALDQVLGDIYVGGMSMAITSSELTNTPSYVRIFAH